MTMETYYGEKWAKLDEEQGMFKVEAQYTVYSIELNAQDFSDLWDYSRHQVHDFVDWPEDYLDHQLERAGCDVIDYEPMFGAYIHIQLDRKDDTEEMWQEIKRIIASYLEDARKWKKETEEE